MAAVVAFAWCCTAVALAGLALELSNLAEFPLLRPAASREFGTVVACVAMRNAERDVRDCLTALLAQPEIAAIVVCDDHSTDATAAQLDAMCAASPRVRFVRDPGGHGKCAALAAAAREARALHPRFLLFTDADVRLGRGAAAALVAHAGVMGTAAVSAWPRTRAAGPWDGLFARTLMLFLLQALPMRRARRAADPRFAAANGQLFLIDTAVYERSGGHAAVGALVEDVALARALKAAGGRTALAGAAAIASTGGYGTLRGNVAGYGRSLRGAAGRAGAFAFAAWQLAAFVMPWLLLPFAPLPASLGVAAIVLAHGCVAQRTGDRWGWAASGTVGGVAAAGAALWCALGSGRFVWRGRPVTAAR